MRGINVDAAVRWIHLDTMVCRAVSVPVDLLDIRPLTMWSNMPFMGAGIPSVLEPLGVDLEKKTPAQMA